MQTAKRRNIFRFQLWKVKSVWCDCVILPFIKIQMFLCVIILIKVFEVKEHSTWPTYSIFLLNWVFLKWKNLYVGIQKVIVFKSNSNSTLTFNCYVEKDPSIFCVFVKDILRDMLRKFVMAYNGVVLIYSIM